MFDHGRLEASGSGEGRTPGQLLADRIWDRDQRIRAEEVGAVLDLKEWLDLHSVDETDPFARGAAGGAGRRSGSDGTPWVDEFAVREYAALRHWSEPTARAFLIDVADLEHRFPKLWIACTVAMSVSVWQARQIVKACRELSQTAAAKVDAEMAGKLPGLSWGRALDVLAAAIWTADPLLAEARRQTAKQARFVQLGRSEGGIRTMIVRAQQGDLIMVYALVDRLADILALEGSTEPAAERRATAFGLLAQPALVLQMLLRHAADGAGSPTSNAAADTAADHAGADEDGADLGDHGCGTMGADDAPFAEEDPARSDGSPGHAPDRGTGSTAEPPDWTAEDFDEPPDPAPVDEVRIPDWWDQRHRHRPAPEPFAPVWQSDQFDPDPHAPDPPASGVRLDLPGLADLLTEQGLRAARPRVVLNVHLTDTTLRTGTGVVRTEGCGPMLAAQLREFLGRHSCAISVRPIFDPHSVPAVDAYEIPQAVRDAVRHRHVASIFPYSSGRGRTMDLDHTDPYRRDGTPGQTGPAALGPLVRGEHRAKTHGLWTVTSPHPGVFIWRAPHGHYFLCTNQGTQHLGPLPTEGPAWLTRPGLPGPFGVTGAGKQRTWSNSRRWETPG